MQKRLFLIVSGMFILCGFLHFIGQFSPIDDPAYTALLKQMNGYKFELAGIQATLVDVMQCWGAYFGCLSIVVGVQNIMVARELENSSPLLRRLTIFTFVVSVALLAIGVVYHTIQTIVFFSITTLILIVALLPQRSR